MHINSLAIVGCGHIATLHADIISKLDNCRLVAVADTDPARAETLASMYGAKAYSSLAGMLNEEELDVVHICTPSHLHVRMAGQCAEKGVNVYLEKPGAISERQLEQLLKLEEQIKIGICFQNRLIPSSKKMIQILHGGSLGKILGARAVITYLRDAAYYERSPWRALWSEAGGGALINQAVLTLDLMVLAMGKATGATATMANHRHYKYAEVEDSIEAYLDFDGRPGLLYCSSAYSENAPILLEFHCEKGRLRLEGEQVTISRKDGQIDHIATGSNSRIWHQGDLASGHPDAINEFYQALARDLPVPLGPKDVASTLRLMYDIYDLAGRNEPDQEWHDLSWGEK